MLEYELGVVRRLLKVLTKALHVAIHMPIYIGFSQLLVSPSCTLFISKRRITTLLLVALVVMVALPDRATAQQTPTDPDDASQANVTLEVPVAATTPFMDGKVDPSAEYIGAETIDIQYPSGSAPAQATVYLVRTDEDLYIGIGPLRPPPRNSQGFPGDWKDVAIRLMLDLNFTRDTVANRSHIQIHSVLNLNNEQTQFLVGNGSEEYVACTVSEDDVPGANCPTFGSEWEVAQANLGDDADPGRGIEFRIAKSLLGEWEEVDGLVIQQLFSGDSNESYLVPAAALVHSPETWAEVSYTDGSAELPRAQISGRVLRGLSANDVPSPLVGHKVSIRTGALLYQQMTAGDGSFNFDVPVPFDEPVRLQPSNCGACRYGDPEVDTGSTQPQSVSELEIIYPGCPSGTCSYARSDFFIKPPAGAVSVSGATPESPVASMILNEAPVVASPGETVRIEGENLHDLAEIYLSPDTNHFDPEGWVLYPATVLNRAADESWVEVEVPPLPESSRTYEPTGPFIQTLDGEWRWVVKDTWSRPGKVTWNRSLPFRLLAPAYPLIHGFGFANSSDKGTLDDFLATYGNNAYICVGALSVCITRVPDPLYWGIWLPVHLKWVADSGGSCVGMAATSQLMHHGYLHPETFDESVHFAGGFTTVERRLDFDYGTLGPIFGPPTPQNLWSVIRMNHGVQTSREFLLEAIKDLDIDLTIEIDSSIHGSPADRYNELLQNPTRQVISMVPELGRGHAVTPYRAANTRINLYDNNDPLDANRYVDVSLSNDTYSFPRPSRNETWRGKAMFTIPLDVWRNERHAPLDIGNFLDGDFVMSLVFGDADAFYATPAGGRWGWEADGTFVDQLPGARSISLLGSADEAVRNAPLILPMNQSSPLIELNSRGGDYLFFAGQGRHTLAMEVKESIQGDADAIAIDYADGNLSSFYFTPEQSAVNILPKVGLDLGERQRALFRWWQLGVENGGTVGFTAMRAEKAAEFTNDSGAETSHFLIVDTVDGAEEAYGTRSFGPFNIPDGAHHRTTIANWPASTQILSQVDLDGDGTFDSSTTLTGYECASTDENGNGIPDDCEEVPQRNQTLHLPLLRD